MRVNTAIAILAMMMAALMSPLTLAEAQDDGTTQIINNSETWTSDNLLDGNVTVASGGVLTIDGSIDVATGSKITVDSGGSLILNGDLNAAESMNEIYMEVYQNTVLEPYFNGLVDSGVLRINMAKEYFSSMDVHVKVGETNLSWTGEAFLDFNIEFSDTQINVNFSGFWQFPVWVDSIQAFESNGVIYLSLIHI